MRLRLFIRPWALLSGLNRSSGITVFVAVSLAFPGEFLVLSGGCIGTVHTRSLPSVVILVRWNGSVSVQIPAHIRREER